MNFAGIDSRVLCVGHDEALLRTRRTVLASRYEAVSVLGIEEMQGLPAEERFDVVLLCHTLSAEECRRGMKLARRRWPAAKVMALSTEQMSCADFADRVVETMKEPRVLFRAVDRLLAAGQ